MFMGSIETSHGREGKVIDLKSDVISSKGKVVRPIGAV